MPGCPIIRFEKHKNASSLVGAMGHHARTIPTPNADPARQHDNQVLWGTDDPKEVARLVAERTDGLVKRKDAVRSVELFLGASDDFWESGGDWTKLGRAHLSMLKREFGESNIIGMGVHMDERRPHFWAIVTPVTPEGKLAASHWLDGPKKLAALLDRAQVEFQPIGMQRARRGVKATHVDMQTIHDANAGNPAAERRLSRELVKRENDAKKRLQALEIAALDAEDRAAKARAKTAEIEARDAVVKAQERQIEAREERLITWQHRLEKLERQLGAMQDKLIEAFAVLPSKVQEKLQALFGMAPPSPPPPPVKKPLVGPSGGLADGVSNHPSPSRRPAPKPR